MTRIAGNGVICVGGPSGPPAPQARRIGGYRASNYWEEQGWKLRNYLLEGYYRTHYKAVKGKIELFDSGDHLYYVYDPPPQLRRHPHWPCFMYRGNGIYWVHFNQKASTVDAGIVTIEKILAEALERYN